MFGKGSQKLETIVGNDTHITGKVSVKGTIRVDGIVEGDVQADWVIVGETGKILGNTRTRGMVVGGSVEGNIEATESAELREKARMVGEIHAPKLGISEGAVFDGRARMKDASKPAGIQEGNVRPMIPTKTAGA
ncbi:polymer-forming cytoskeletal protein [Candidatus Deferrimicrobium sp.]|jgi:cytoskeletal protein CcmA (bactofilin family)|uniref:bactofilin family protein n=1 Tax=Candidatus Deferrimicrobium sp. TaxID=3060586 RepID=UPI002ED97F32